MRGWLIVLMAWAGVVLACNLPLAARVEPLSPPTLPAESAEDLSNEESESAENGTDPVPTATLLPTADNSSCGEVIQLAPTVTPRATPSGNTTSTEGDGGTLTLDYEISWELNQSDTNFALATVTLLAKGGNGEYSFFRDDIPTGGSQFVYRWGSCQPNPGTFRVNTGDGQSATVEYFTEAPCP